MKINLYRKGLILFLVMVFFRPLNLSGQNLLVESLTGPITQNEINAFKAYIKSTTKTPLPVDNTGNILLYGATGMNTRGMGIMYEITEDTAFLNRMILFSDYILACRNDNVNGKKLILETGNVDPAWPNFDDNPAPANNQGWLIGGGQGGTVEHFAYCAELILKHPNLWNLTIPDGNKFGYGATYLQRAKRYIDEANVTFDKVIYPHSVNSTTNILVWWDQPNNILAWNQQMMALGGISHTARCLEILGTDATRLTLYNNIIAANSNRFITHLSKNKYSNNGKNYFVWSYVEQNPLRNIEDNTEHSTYDVFGMHRNYRYGRYGVAKDIMVNFANTMADTIMKTDGTYAMTVDGVTSGLTWGGMNSIPPRTSIRPDWIIMSGFRPDIYVPFANSQMSNNDTRPGTIRAASEILWVKYMNYNKLWNNFEYKALTIPGKIEAEHYNLGGEGVSYHDLTTGNTLNAFRMDNVDIQATTDAGGGYNIGAVQAGEWMDYTVNVTTAGIYKLQARVAATAAGKTFHIELDGVNISGAIAIPNTGNYQTFQTVTVTTPALTTGQKVMRIVMDSPSFNLNHITFTLNQAPTVSITSPANNVVFTSGSAVTINANASDADGTVAKVEFFIDGTKLGEDASSPYSINWTSTAGVHWIKAISTDNLGTKSKGDSVSITVRGPYAGTVWAIPGKIEAENYDIGGQGISYNDFTAGNSGNIYRTDDVDITTTNDAGGGYHIFYVQAGDWMEYSVNVTTAGTYILQLRVAATAVGKTFHVEMDGQNISGVIIIPNTGSYQTFQTVNVTTTALTTGKKLMRIVMDTPGFNLNYVSFALNQSPLVSITAPAGGSTFISGNSVTINASASDADGSIAKVEFFVDGTKIGEDATSPYSFAWTATTGTHSLTAIVTDNSGAKTTSTAISITVDNPNQLPNVSISSPTAGMISKLGDIISINATATDADGTVAKVEFYAGTTKIGEVATSPYSFSWTPSSAGAYTLTAKATDNKGAVKISSDVNITVDTPPVISISSPVNNAGFTEGANVTISVVASDADGSIDKVEFFVDGNKIGEDLINPYSFIWTATSGTHSLTVKATDDLGISTVSSAISIKVNIAPVVSVISPIADTSFFEGDVVVLKASAADADGNIASVEFFMDGVSIGLDVSSPYSISSTPLKGIHTITAEATDNSGSKTTSAVVIIYVNTNQAPEVNIISPLDPENFITGETVSIEAEAYDSDGSITKVEFYIDGIKVGEDLNSPYTFNWTADLGTHSIKSIATDDRGSISQYSEITISVVQIKQSPLVTILSPSDNGEFTKGDLIPIQIAATDNDGSISNVVLYIDDIKVNEISSAPYDFTWTATGGTHTIKVIAFDNNGNQTESSVVNILVDEPTSIISEINSNTVVVYPNPTLGELTISLNNNSLREATLILCDQTGKELAVLLKGNLSSGIYSINLDALGLSAGIYFIKFISSDFVKTQLVAKQ